MIKLQTAKKSTARKPAPKKKPAASKTKTATAAKSNAKPKAKAAPKAEPKREMHPNQDRTGDRKLQVEKVVEALRNAGGIKSVAAHNLNVSRTTLYAFLSENPEVEDILEEIEDEVKDLAESKMLQAIRAGDGQMIRFYLERKAKERGYNARVESTGPNGGPIETRQRPDLAHYTDEELEVLRNAAARRESNSGKG